MKIYKKIAKVSNETLGKLRKTGEVKYNNTKFSYNDYNKDIHPILKGACQANSLFYNFVVEQEDNKQILKLNIVDIESGETVCSSVEVPNPTIYRETSETDRYGKATMTKAKEIDSQKFGISLTKAKRYLVVLAFDLNTEEDTDGFISHTFKEESKTDNERVKEVKQELDLLFQKVKNKEEVEDYIFNKNNIDKENITLKDIPTLRTAINAVYNKMRAKGARK
jgi:hypothetical protein